MSYLDYIYNVVKLEAGGMDAIYKDYIIKLVGEWGFKALHSAKLIEGCGSVNLRKLYTLCEWGDLEKENDIYERNNY